MWRHRRNAAMNEVRLPKPETKGRVSIEGRTTETAIGP